VAQLEQLKSHEQEVLERRELEQIKLPITNDRDGRLPAMEDILIRELRLSSIFESIKSK